MSFNEKRLVILAAFLKQCVKVLTAPPLNGRTAARATGLDACLKSCARRSLKRGSGEELPSPSVN